MLKYFICNKTTNYIILMDINEDNAFINYYKLLFEREQFNQLMQGKYLNFLLFAPDLFIAPKRKFLYQNKRHIEYLKENYFCLIRNLIVNSVALQ